MTSKRENELLKGLRNTTVKVPTAKKAPVPSEKEVQSTGRGKPINLYLHPEDMSRIRQLVGYLSNQGERVSDSQVVKAALQVAEGNAALLAALRFVSDRDMRFKKARSAKA